MNWLRHAFAVDPPGPIEPSAAQRPIVDRVCAEVVRRGLATPALAFLEMSRPLNALAAQTLRFLSPVLAVLVTADERRGFADFLERRGSIDYFCRRIEELDRRASQQQEPSAGLFQQEPPPGSCQEGPLDGPLRGP